MIPLANVPSICTHDTICKLDTKCAKNLKPFSTHIFSFIHSLIHSKMSKSTKMKSRKYFKCRHDTIIELDIICKPDTLCAKT